MCTGRVDLRFLLSALREGADGAIIGGCWPGECHYTTEGNYEALGNIFIGKRLLRLIGVAEDRFRIEWVGAAEGNRFAQVMDRFAKDVEALGPLWGDPESEETALLQEKLDALLALVPWLHLVERQKLRVPHRTVEAYEALYSSPETERLFEGPIAERLAAMRLLRALGREPQPSSRLAERLGMSGSELSKLLQETARLGQVRYDAEQGLYSLAGQGG